MNKETDAKKPISQQDLEDYLATVSDFALEMRCLNVLAGRGFSCEHGGTYVDPITAKARQFDLRATLASGNMELHLAVECKNIRDDSPLLVHARQRRSEESFHDLFINDPPPAIGFSVRKLSGGESAYHIGSLVGKQVDQVARKGNGSFGTSDAEVFEK